MNEEENANNKQPTKNNILAIMDILDISIDTLSELTGYAVSTIYGIQKKRTPLAYEQKSRLSKALGCTEEELEMKNFSEDNFRKKYNIKNNVKGSNYLQSDQTYSVDDETGIVTNENGVETLVINMYHDFASAGKGEARNESDEIMIRVFSSTFVDMTGLVINERDIKNGRFSIIRARGDSMEDYIKDGDILVIDNQCRTIDYHKQILVFRTERAMFVKEVYLSENGNINIISYNKQYEDHKNKTHDEIEQIYGDAIEIIGKVIWHGSKTTYKKF